jgi:hypothetical protein
VFEKIYEIITGCELFYGVGARGLIARMARIFGEVPPHWASYWASNENLKDQGALHSFFFFWFAFLTLLTLLKHFVPEISAARANAQWNDFRPPLVHAFKSEEDADCFIDLLRSMLVLDPAERPSVRQVIETYRWLELNNSVAS